MKKQHYITLAVIVMIVVAVLIGKNVTQEKVVGTDMQTTIATSTATSTKATSTAVATIVQTSSGMIPVATKPAQPAYIPTLTVEKATLKFGETKVIGGVTITVKDIKDTRCVSANRCDTADDARVRLGVKGPITTKNVSLIEDQGFLVDKMRVILDDVTPEVEKNKSIAETDYRFVIIVESMK